MYTKIINKLGLSLVQSELLNSLLTLGPDKASNLAKKTKRPRGVAYKGLEELINLKLVSKTENLKKITIYSAEHPSYLENIIEQREKDLKREKDEFFNNLPDLVSAFNLISNKPGVRFYEGEEGVKKVLMDTLTSNPEKKLYTFSDVASYADYLGEWNTNHYAVQRKKLNVYEEVIIPDNKKALDYMKGYKSNDITDIIFIDHKSYPFSTEINIYNNKVSFVTFRPDFMIGVIIENEDIFKSFLSIFKFIWDSGKKHPKENQPDWTGNLKDLNSK